MKKFLPTLIIACAVHLASVPNVNAAPLSEKVKIAKQQNAKQSQKLNINSASAEELQTLPGIGASKAKAIIAYRTKSGKFSSVEELTKVKGIGPKMLAKLKDKVVAS